MVVKELFEMKHQTLSSKIYIESHSTRGMAIMIVLGFLLMGMTLMMGLMNTSSLVRQSSQQNISKTQIDFDSDALSERVKNEILQIIQTEIALARPVPLELTGEFIKSQLSAPIESQESILWIRCLGQGISGAGRQSDCKADQVFPKVYDFSVQVIDPTTGAISATETEIHIEQAGLSAYAFFIKNETEPVVTVGPTNFAGIFGLNFASPSGKQIKFKPGLGEISFQNLFLTNLNPDQLDIERQASVHFNKGALTAYNSVSFSGLDSLHTELKENAVNKRSPTHSDEVQCSHLTLQPHGDIKILAFLNPDCSDLIAEDTIEVGNNQALYARGSKIRLDASSPEGVTRVGNIAIIADGDVELRSSIVRDKDDRSPLEGFPIVMAKGDLLISKEMRTLRRDEGYPQLGQARSITGASLDPTIQVDLSYVSLRTDPHTMGGSLKFDPSLIDKSTPASSARNLGLAAFNGLFISEKSPVSRVLYPHSSGSVHGFSQVQWTYPPALSAVGTDWFRAQLEGGALRAIVTRSERKITDRKQAQLSYDCPASVCSAATIRTGREIE